MFEQIQIVKKSYTIVFNLWYSFCRRVFAVEQFGILRWKAKGKVNDESVDGLQMKIRRL